MFKNLGHLILNYLYDFYYFLKYSGTLSNNSEEKVQGKLIYYYHAIEKGLISEDVRFRFGKLKIKRLLELINIWLNKNYNRSQSQFIVSCSVLIKYYDFHLVNGVDVSDILSVKQYDSLKMHVNIDVGGVLYFESKKYFENKNASFDVFSNSRHSVRHFNGDKIAVSKIEEVIAIAKNAPSVCNRQSSQVLLINNEEQV